jgi:hypothetical protein
MGLFIVRSPRIKTSLPRSAAQGDGKFLSAL